MSNTKINIAKNGTTTLATAGKYCDRNIDVNVDIPQSGNTEIIWKEDFSILPSGVSDNVKMDSFYIDGWEAYIAANGYSETDNYIIFKNNRLQMVKSQGENRANNIVARKTLPEFNYKNFDKVTIEFDYSMDRPYDLYAYYPIIDIINENNEQIYGLAFGSDYYGCFVIPHGVNSVLQQGMSIANTDNSRAIARNTKFVALCDGGTMHIKILLDISGGFSETIITKDGVTYTTPTKELLLDSRLSSLNIKKIGLYASNAVQQPVDTPVTSTYDNIKIYAENVDSFEEYIKGTLTEFTSYVEEVRSQCFWWANSFVNVKLPNVLKIKGGAFWECSGMKNLYVPKLEVLEDSSLYGSYGLERIDLPSIKQLQGWPFYFCSALTTVVIGTTDCVLTDGYAFQNDMNTWCTFYVPDEALETYKAATNWCELAAYGRIKGISELPT